MDISKVSKEQSENPDLLSVPILPCCSKTLDLKEQGNGQLNKPWEGELWGTLLPTLQSAMNQTSRAKVDKWSRTLETDLVSVPALPFLAEGLPTAGTSLRLGFSVSKMGLRKVCRHSAGQNKRWWRTPTPQKSCTTTADGVARIPHQSRLHHRTRCPRAPTVGAQCRQLSSGPGKWLTTRPLHSQQGVYGGPGRCTPTHRAPVPQAPPTAVSPSGLHKSHTRQQGLERQITHVLVSGHFSPLTVLRNPQRFPSCGF